jgi:hypothetical protein
MLFTGVDNQTVELRIVNYQFPKINDGTWDANWLNIHLIVKSSVGNWETVDACLITWEVHSLITWLDQLSNNKSPIDSEMNFTEPNISFQLLNEYNSEKKTFRIKFDLDCRPRSATDDKEYYVDIIADSQELERLALELKKELAKFPERT